MLGVAGVFLQAGEILVADVVHFSAADQHILRRVLFDARQRAVAV